MRSFLVHTALLLSVALIMPAAEAQQKNEPLVEQVRSSIERGVKHLRQAQLANGSWEVNLETAGVQGGWTSLAVLSLLNSGLPADDKTVQRGLQYLRKLEPTMTYVRALQTMVLVEAGMPEDRERIAGNVKWLIDARVIKDGKLMGWTYNTGLKNTSDNSNTQYALLGLWAGKQGGAEINNAIWESIRDFYVTTQLKDGPWIYSPQGGPVGHNAASLTMTTAGLCGVLIAGMELNSGREKIQADGTASNCGEYDENTAAAKSLSWIGRNFKLDVQQRVFYNMYGIERAGRLTGLRFIGGHDWYREGCEYLVKHQSDDGKWVGAGAWDRWPVVSTSFALLFLSKGRTPVLMTKLVHGDWPRLERDTDWNNDRNDLRHLVDFAGKELFNKLPLAWQSFDLMKAAQPADGRFNMKKEDEERAVADLLQSPIVYFNGHNSPRTRFQDAEKEMLKRYVDNGGFIFAEACCGSPAFDAGFKELVAELWPKNELTDLDANHPVWQSHFIVSPGNPYRLMGLSSGCKTVLIYSPQDLSCRWESNDTKDAKGLKAFQLGSNIIAYATGREPPRPRLTQVQIAGARKDPETTPRGYIKVAQLKHTGDFKPAPRAMHNLMDHLHRLAGLDVVLKTSEISINDRELIDFKFIYMHGRKTFAFEPEELEHMRFNLQNGGVLLADACCGKAGFDKAFRTFAKQLFPKHELEQVPLDDVLFSRELNGEALTEANIRARRDIGGQIRNMPPFLEGIKVDNRWALLYSKYDLGCALERHQASDCLGYHPDSAFRIAGAAVLYSLRP